MLSPIGRRTAVVAVLTAIAACAPAPSSTTVAVPPEQTYRIGLLGEPPTDNYWSFLAAQPSVWSGYVLAEQPAGLYRDAAPSGALIPFVADGPPAAAVDEAGTWVVTQGLRPDAAWSDGTPLTAADLVFTFETVTRLGLGGRWPAAFGLPVPDDPATARDERRSGLVGIAAIDEHTVRLTFDGPPGLEAWPYATGTAPILPRHFWEPSAAASDTLLAASGAGAPVMGAFAPVDPRPGEAARLVANEHYPLAGERVSVMADGSATVALDGSPVTGDVLVEYEEGPFVDFVTYRVYESATDALEALSLGDIDIILSPLGLGNGLRDVALADPEIDVTVNPASGYRYLAFNLRKAPLSHPALRRALACMIDKELMTKTLDGAVIPVWSQLVAADPFWSNPDPLRDCAGLSPADRLATSVQILAEAGYRWETTPAWNGEVVSPRGQGLTAPDGTPVQTLSLLVPGPGYDPLRTTYAFAIASWAADLGIPIAVEPTGYDVVVDRVFTTAPAFDLYILAWELVPFPSHLGRFFSSSEDLAAGGVNTSGYASPEVDGLAARLAATTDPAEARRAAVAIDDLVGTDLPYVVLYSPTIVEAHRADVSLPFTAIAGGLQAANGMVSTVRITDG